MKKKLSVLLIIICCSSNEIANEVEKSQDRYTKDQASTMISYIIGRETVDKDTFIKIDVSMPYSEFLNSK